MRKIPGENLTANGKSSKNKTPSKGKTMFGYNVLGFGAGGSAFAAFDSADKYFYDVDQAIDYFTKTSIGQASLLVKGSRSFTLEKLVDVFH